MGYRKKDHGQRDGTGRPEVLGSLSNSIFVSSKDVLPSLGCAWQSPWRGQAQEVQGGHLSETAWLFLSLPLLQSSAHRRERPWLFLDNKALI